MVRTLRHHSVEDQGKPNASNKARLVSFGAGLMIGSYEQTEPDKAVEEICPQK